MPRRRSRRRAAIAGGLALAALSLVLCWCPQAGAQQTEVSLPGWDAYAAPRSVYGGGVVLRKGDDNRSLTLSGRGSLCYRANAVSGPGASAYGNQYWDTKPVSSEAQLTVSGWALDQVRIDATISQGPFGPSRNDFSVMFDAGPAQISYGRVQAQMGANEFMSFRKQLWGLGVEGGSRDQRLQYSLFASKVKGQVRREAFAGQDSPGPYHLRYTPIVDGSEVVKVDEQRMVRGQDYVIDYYGGWLTFEVSFGGNPKTTMIPSTSTISVSYEQAGGGGGSGMIYGLRSTIAAGEGLSFEAAYLTQQSDYQPSSSSGSVMRREEFIGAGSPGPFQLSYSPVDTGKPVLVYVDGALKIEGVDYLFSANSGYLQFTSPIPPGALVVVEYYQLTDGGGAGGDKHLVGLTAKWTPVANTNVRLALAASDSQGGPAGTALSLEASGALLDSRLNLHGRYEDTEPTFSQIEGVGFQQQARGFSLGADYRAHEFVSTNFDWRRQQTSTGLYFGSVGGAASGYDTGTTTGYSVLTDQKTLGARTSFPNAPQVSLSRSIMSNQGTNSGATYVSDALRVSHRLGALSGSLSLSRNKQGFSALGEAAQTTPGRDPLVTYGANASLSYLPSSSGSLSIGCSNSATAATATQPGRRGSTVDMSATWNPSPGFGLVLTHNLSRSRGGLASSLSGTAGNNAATAQTEGDQSTEQPVYSNDRTGLSLNYASSGGRYAVGLDLGQQSYRGGSTGYRADSKSHDINLYLRTYLSSSLGANLSLQRQSLRYLSQTATTLNTQLALLSLDYKPQPAEQYTLSCQYMLSATGGAGDSASTRMLTMGLGGHRRLAERTSLSSNLQFQSVAGAFDDSKRLTLLTTYSYRLNEFLSANANLRHVRYDSLRETGYGGGDYIANLLSLSLSAGF